jgi:hypothetical protein
MKAFVGFLWSDNGDLSAWSWNLNKQKLIEWVQSEYLVQSKAGKNNIGISKLFNNLSDIKVYKKSTQGNERKAIDEFLKFVNDAPKELKGYFIDNQPHDN